MAEDLNPEQRARRRIDARLAEAGWAVQSRDEINLAASRGVAVREFKLAPGHGKVDYLLFVDRQPVGVLEAKPEGHTLSGVEPQAKLYATGLPDHLRAPVDPLSFHYLSSGSITRFTNLLDPHPRSRRLFQVHRPATLAEWLAAEPLRDFAQAWWSEAAEAAGEPPRPSSLRSRMQALPPVDIADLWRNKLEALENLERSLRQDRPRALIQMATGSGKTLLAVTAIYRLIKFGGARRVLFLVDRTNLGEQAEKEFQAYRTPDDNRKFTELYNVQRLTSNTIAPASKVVITTIQRLYSMLKGEPELDPAERWTGPPLRRIPAKLRSRTPSGVSLASASPSSSGPSRASSSTMTRTTSPLPSSSSASRPSATPRRQRRAEGGGAVAGEAAAQTRTSERSSRHEALLREARHLDPHRSGGRDAGRAEDGRELELDRAR